VSTQFADRVTPNESARLPRHDYFILYALCGMERYPEARRLAKELGPELFPPGPARAIASALVLGKPPTLASDAPEEFRLEWQQLRRSMLHSCNPNCSDWAVDAGLRTGTCRS
jgi:hypothetical protein